jgi:hypothetical protein
MLATALTIYFLDGEHVKKYTFQRVSALKCILIFWRGVGRAACRRRQCLPEVLAGA